MFAAYVETEEEWARCYVSNIQGASSVSGYNFSGPGLRGRPYVKTSDKFYRILHIVFTLVKVFQ